MNRPGCESEGCEGSNLLAKLSDSWLYMPPYTTYSILVGILLEPSIIEISGYVRSRVGMWSDDE